jgi:hypothetical protein
LPAANPAASVSKKPQPTITGKRSLRRVGVETSFGLPAGSIEEALPIPALDESVSRFNRFKSARSSAALWQRNSRSFSKALFKMTSNCGGNPGLSWTSDAGTLFRIASKITADVVPENGCLPVAIS